MGDFINKQDYKQGTFDIQRMRITFNVSSYLNFKRSKSI